MADNDPLPTPKLPLLLHRFVTPYVLLVAALAIPHHRRIVAAVFLPLLWASYHHILQTSSPSPPLAFVIGCFVVFHALLSLNLLLLQDPRREFQRTLNAESYPDSLLRRLGWILDLVTNMRGIGWSWEVRPITHDNATTLRVFLWRRAGRLLLIWAWMDATMFWMQQVDAAYFLPDGNAYDGGSAVGGVLYAGPFSASARQWDGDIVPRGFPEMPRDGVCRALYVGALHTWRTVLQGVTVYMAMNGVYTELAVVFSAIGGLVNVMWPGAGRLQWLDWRSWPNMFGGWARGDWGHGLTGMWGRAWHGLFKYAFTSPSRYICSALQLAPSSPGVIALKLFTPFAMSGLLHFAGSYTLSSNGWGSARFFFLQPFGILLEHGFLYIYGRSSTPPKTLARVTPYVWMFVWCVLTSTALFNEMRYGGVWALQPVPVSVWRGLAGVGEGWWAWRRDTRMGWRSWWLWDESIGGWGIRM